MRETYNNIAKNYYRAEITKLDKWLTSEVVSLFFRVMDIRQLNFAPESFDGAVALGSIIHIARYDAQKVLTGICSVLKTNGLFFATIKEGIGEEECVEDYYGVQGLKRSFILYSENEFRNFLSNSGLRIVSFQKEFIKAH